MKLGLLFFSISAMLLWQTEATARGGSFSGGNTYYVGAGLLTYAAGKAATSATSTNKPFFADIYTQLSLSAIYPMGGSWSFSPMYFYGIPSKTSPEGEEKFSVSGFGLRGIYLFTDSLNFHIGVGGLFYKIKGNGGVVTQSNGSGSSNFPTPSGSKSASRYTLDLGTTYILSNWRFEGAILITSPTNSTKMALTPLFTISTGFM